MNFNPGFDCRLQHSCDIHHTNGNAQETTANICIDINECLANPCENGGTCLNTEGDYQCTCPCGWIGKNCNGKKDHVVTNSITLNYSSSMRKTLKPITNVCFEYSYTRSCS